MPMPPLANAPAQSHQINIPLYIREGIFDDARDDETRHIVVVVELRKQDGITVVRLTHAPKWRRRSRLRISECIFACLSLCGKLHA